MKFIHIIYLLLLLSSLCACGAARCSVPGRATADVSAVPADDDVGVLFYLFIIIYLFIYVYGNEIQNGPITIVDGDPPQWTHIGTRAFLNNA